MPSRFIGKKEKSTALKSLTKLGAKRVATRKKPVQHEYIEQCAFIAWARAQTKYPGLELLHCSLNGVKLTLMQSVRAKKQGMLSGVPDLFLPVSRHGFHGLFIEMKAKKGRASQGQIAFMNSAALNGYLAVVCVGAEAAIQCIKDYYMLTENKLDESII